MRARLKRVPCRERTGPPTTTNFSGSMKTLADRGHMRGGRDSRNGRAVIGEIANVQCSVISPGLLKESYLRRTVRQPEVLISELRCNSAARRAMKKPGL